jgi:hypothetical protein
MGKDGVPGEEVDHFAFCCWKFEVEAYSKDGTSVALIDVNGRPTVPLFFVHNENLNPEILALKIAEALCLSALEFLDFRSCNLTAAMARDNLAKTLGLS